MEGSGDGVFGGRGAVWGEASTDKSRRPRGRKQSATGAVGCPRGPTRLWGGFYSLGEGFFMPVSVVNSRLIFEALKACDVKIFSALPETWLVHLIRMADEDP